MDGELFSGVHRACPSSFQPFFISDLNEDIQVSDIKLRKTISWIQNSEGFNIGGEMVRCNKMKSVEDQYKILHLSTTQQHQQSTRKPLVYRWSDLAAGFIYKSRGL